MRKFGSLIIILLLYSCSSMTDSSHTNRLADSTSPYLRQHAGNPVDWYPWGSEALDKAKAENKPILLSIGYSSCHWCHVMAHESFENDTIAAIMNEKFINIKLDREERPDIDQIYMEAVQNMGLRGGWPLNVFLTADQRPFYGGTYFPPENWAKLLRGISDAYMNNYQKLSESADAFAQSLQTSEFVKYRLTADNPLVTNDEFITALDSVATRFDSQWGGMQRAPKFPMPSTWNFILNLGHHQKADESQEHVLFTLDKIAAGGIYDQMGGGFSRYSVDAEWHVPHFEKMLYDNGQLMSLYAHAYKITQKREYLRVLEESAEWLRREMTDESGGFYSALDADSEGEEGKFYVWTKAEIDAIAGTDKELISTYFDVSVEGNWEEKNVPRRLFIDSDFASRFNLSVEDLDSLIKNFKENALNERAKRVRPGLDDKIISGWNGLMLTGLLDAYQATQLGIFKELAVSNAEFLKTRMIRNQTLLRLYRGNQEAFLEDYAAVIQAFIRYYETFFDETYLQAAKGLTDLAIDQFFDPNENLFYFTSGSSEELIARKKELFDNVIPSSNSMMAENLYRLGIMLDYARYKNLATNMVRQVAPLIKSDLEFMANWANVAYLISNPTPEVILVGEKFEKMARNLNARYLPNKIIMGTREKSNFPLFEYKTNIGTDATIYVCFDKTCKLPVTSVEDALEQIEGK